MLPRPLEAVRPAFGVLLICAAALVFHVPVSHAASIQRTSVGNAFDYLAAPGEANQVTVTSANTQCQSGSCSPGNNIITDAGATITSNSELCVQVSTHSVSCHGGVNLQFHLGNANDTFTENGRLSSNITLEAWGGTGNDTLVGPTNQDGGAVSLFGQGGSDTITARGDEATLDGGPGVDQITGGPSDDAIFGDSPEDVLCVTPLRTTEVSDDTIDGGGGRDTVNYRCEADDLIVDLNRHDGAGSELEYDLLSNIENIEGGRGDDLIVGAATSKVLQGGPGDDQIVINPSVIAAIGGSGDDVIDFSELTERVDYSSPTAIVSGQSMRAEDFEDVIGGSGDDRITIQGGGDGSIALGGSGNDVLQGNIGTTLFGEAGDDTLVTQHSANALGGPGADTFQPAGTGSGALEGGGGVDHVTFAQESRDVTIDLSGDPVSGYDSTISIGPDIERATGGSGDDYLVPDQPGASFAGGPGIDSIDYAYKTSGVNVSFDGIANDGTTGSPADNVASDIEGVFGTGYDDRLTGGGADEFFGPGAGSDTVTAGAGIDVVWYEDITTPLDIRLDSGVVLGAGGSRATLNGIEDVVGGAGNDTITGSGVYNDIDGSGGNDSIGAIDGAEDYISCGAGTDALQADIGIDTTDTTCEQVNGPNPPANQDPAPVTPPAVVQPAVDQPISGAGADTSAVAPNPQPPTANAPASQAAPTRVVPKVTLTGASCARPSRPCAVQGGAIDFVLHTGSTRSARVTLDAAKPRHTWKALRSWVVTGSTGTTKPLTSRRTLAAGTYRMRIQIGSGRYARSIVRYLTVMPAAKTVRSVSDVAASQPRLQRRRS